MPTNQHPQNSFSELASYNVTKTLWLRKNIIVFCAVASVFLAFFYTSQINPTYVATAKIMVLPNKSKNLFENNTLDTINLLSQIEIMQSTDVLRQVVINQKLYRDTKFGDVSGFESLSPLKQQEVIATVKENLTIIPIPGTSIVEITYQASDRDKSIVVANAIAQAYDQSEKIKIRAVAADSTQWLANRLNILRTDISKIETALQSMHEKNGYIFSQSDHSGLIKIDFLTKKLSEIQKNHEETKGLIDRVAKNHRSGEYSQTILMFLNNQVVENLQAAKTGLNRQKEILGRRYGPNHPRMLALESEFKVIESKLNKEVEIFIKSLRKKIQVQENQIKDLDIQINEYTPADTGRTETRLEVKNLEIELNILQGLLSKFTASYLESTQFLNTDRSLVRVIAPAISPTETGIPDKKFMILWGGITGLFLGMLIALVLERIRTTFRSPQEIESLLQMHVYATLPKIKLNKNTSALNYILNNPASLLMELVRSLFVSLQLRDSHTKSGGRIVTMTSTNTNEGKTTCSVLLATVAAQSGKSVLIIDTDMRRPSLHKAYGLGNARGLVDYLSDRLPLDETIYKKHKSNVHIMTSKSVPTSALTLLGTERMETLLRRVRDMYDLIILDCPTSRIFSDARVMANMSDKTFYVVEWKKTTRDDLVNSVKLFTDMDYSNISFVLNKVGNKKLVNFNKGEMAYMKH